MIEFLENVILVTGHYGVGKTNLAINLAKDLRQQGKQVALVDLDIVNPYFRTADFLSLAQQWGIELFASPYANSNVDLPVMASQLSALLSTSKTVVIDVGGDDAGAVAIAQYAAQISVRPYSMLYVVNQYRHLMKDVVDAVDLMQAIQRISRLHVTHIVNNSHLSYLTTLADVEETQEYALEVAGVAQIPLAFTAVKREIAACISNKKMIYPVDLYVKVPWQ